MTEGDTFQARIKRLQDRAQLLSYQKERLELGKKQLEYSIEALVNQNPGEAYLAVGPIFVKYAAKAVKARLEDRIRTMEARLKVMDKRMKQIWAESQALQEEMKKAK